jgi:hypothetical protein
MSSANARVSAETAGSGVQQSLLELLAPDREPRPQSYGRAAVAQPTRLRAQLSTVLLSLRSGR